MLKIKNISVLFVFLLNPLIAAELQLESGIKRNTLIELFTSEGCSSCPPAEKYLNSLKYNKELWKNWIPVAFHVDYWDYIGWKDRYAKKEFGLRQSRYAKLQHASTVYTPAFMINGSSWRKGLFSNTLPEDDSHAGNLIVSLSGNKIHASFKSVKENKNPLILNIAILGMGLTTHIERGENKGRIAKHEFVVVGFGAMESVTSTWNMTLPELHYSGAKKYALAVWVSDINKPTPLQAVGGLMKDNTL